MKKDKKFNYKKRTGGNGIVIPDDYYNSLPSLADRKLEQKKAKFEEYKKSETPEEKQNRQTACVLMDKFIKKHMVKDGDKEDVPCFYDFHSRHWRVKWNSKFLEKTKTDDGLSDLVGDLCIKIAELAPEAPSVNGTF